MSVDQYDVAEFYCNSLEDAQKILDYLKALSELQKKSFKEVRGWSRWDLVIGDFPVDIDESSFYEPEAEPLKVSFLPKRAWCYNEALHFFDIFLASGLCNTIYFKSYLENGQLKFYSNENQECPCDGWECAFIDVAKWCEERGITESENVEEGEGPENDPELISAAIEDACLHDGLDPYKEDDEDY